MLVSAVSHTSEGAKVIDDNQPAAIKFKGTNRFGLGAKKVSLSELIGSIAKNESIHIPSLGNWSLIDMIEYILDQIGPSHVYLTSWAVKEKAVVSLLNLRTQGVIKSLHCLFDSRVPSTCPDAWQLSQANIESLKLTKIHAKVVAIQSDTHSISIVSTANLTTNPRIERYVITESDLIYNYEKSWIKEAISGGKPFN
jgi:hypothetical protein